MENLPECDVILWILSARNRAIAIDQQYLVKLKDFYDRMIFGINQVDLVEPLDWDMKKNMPSLQQQKHLAEIIDDKRKRIEDVVGKRIKITVFGAKQFYRLSDLFASMVDACPEERLWLFQMIKGFSAKDWLDRVEGISEKEKAEILQSP